MQKRKYLLCVPVNYDKISVSTESTSVKRKIAFRQPIRKGRESSFFQSGRCHQKRCSPFPATQMVFARFPNAVVGRCFGSATTAFSPEGYLSNYLGNSCCPIQKPLAFTLACFFHQGFSHRIRSYKIFSNILFKRL